MGSEMCIRDRALLADPVVTSVNNAEKLLNNMISAQHKYLSYLN